MPVYRRARAAVAAGALGAGLLAPMVLPCVGYAHAQEQRRHFDIPAGPAAPAVNAFARQAGLNVLASGEALQGVHTRAVHGPHTPAEALARMLAGTGLTGRANPGGAWLIVPGQPSHAQAPGPGTAAPAPLAPSPLPDVGEVIVVGTKASQQSSISAKKNAATATDVIVAEDVGSFPDRNIAEAVSRIAGISLERGDFGEGRRVDLRGNGPERTRIEIDGMALLAAGGSDMNLGGGGRGVELRELTADLLSSVTVVTGATPDMTEGSLGGAILIKTRSSLDFKARHLSARVAGTASSLNREWTPNLNLVFADRLLPERFGQRLGVLVNLTGTALRNEGHFNQNATSGIAGYARSADLDGSLDKTFTFQPQTVNGADPAAAAPLFRAPVSSGGTIDFESTTVLLAKAAGAQTKDDCRTAFPAPSDADLAAMTSNAVRAAATRFRSDALTTCLNQWNDYTPSRLRNLVKRNDDRRANADVRIDFKASAALSVYGRLMKNRRDVIDELASLERGRPQPAGADYNLVPSTILVDSTHHLTRAAIVDAGYFVDNIHNPMTSRSRYAQAGGAWRAPGLKVDFMAAQSRARFARGDARLSGIGYTYGRALLTAQPDGSWRVDHPAGTPDQAAHERYAELLPQADPRAAQLSRPATLTYAPRAGEMAERQVKLDVAWHPRLPHLPWLGTQKWGASRRHYAQQAWIGTSGGLNVAADSAHGPAAAVLVPASQVRIGLQACSPGGDAHAQRDAACPPYGYQPGAGAFVRRGNVLMRPGEYQALLAAVLPGRRTSPFFRGASGRPTGLTHGWAELDVPRAIEELGIATMNHDCLKSCLGTDGQVYRQPFTGIADRVDALYWMSDFDLSELPGLALPAGMELHGNVGWRYVRSHVQGRGLVTVHAITKGALWNAARPYDPAGVRTVTRVQEARLASSRHDVLPMLNLMFWPIRDRLVLRYARARAIARHPDGDLVPGGACTMDAVAADAGAPMQCTGDFGNPAMRPLTNTNHNLSLEWYPSRGAMVALSAYRQRGTAGPARRVTVTGDRLFAASSVSDPATGATVADIEFTHRSAVNGTPNERTGWELAVKAALARLPGLLRHTGLDANYSRSRPKLIDGHHRDLLTGDYQDAPYVPSSSWNLSLWYDDGRFSARAALQVVGSVYKSIGPAFAGGTDLRNYNAVGVETITAPPWNPGSANFDDATRYVDLKFSYKHSPRLELFGELRNAARRMVVRSQGPYNHFASGAPTVNEFGYTGSRATIGANLRY